jgi:hypothetical protein
MIQLASQPKEWLGSKEAEMRIIGCDLHCRQQTMLDVESGEVEDPGGRAGTGILYRTTRSGAGGH